jgi:hypothetical protein
VTLSIADEAAAAAAPTAASRSSRTGGADPGPDARADHSTLLGLKVDTSKICLKSRPSQAAVCWATC